MLKFNLKECLCYFISCYRIIFVIGSYGMEAIGKNPQNLNNIII